MMTAMTVMTAMMILTIKHCTVDQGVRLDYNIHTQYVDHIIAEVIERIDNQRNKNKLN